MFSFSKGIVNQVKFPSIDGFPDFAMGGGGSGAENIGEGEQRGTSCHQTNCSSSLGAQFLMGVLYKAFLHRSSKSLFLVLLSSKSYFNHTTAVLKFFTTLVSHFF